MYDGSVFYKNPDDWDHVIYVMNSKANNPLNRFFKEFKSANTSLKISKYLEDNIFYLVPK